MSAVPNLRLRVKWRAIRTGAFTDPPVQFTVNCWRVQFVWRSSGSPIIDGVNMDGFNQGSVPSTVPNALAFTVGGVYDQEGRPVYINQTFNVQPNGAFPMVLLVCEEYLERDARQNN